MDDGSRLTWVKPIPWQSQVLWMAIGLILANVLLLLPRSSSMPLVGGLLLFCVMPGLALVNLVFAKRSRLSTLTRLLLGMAVSYVVSNIVVLGMSLIPGRIDVRELVGVLDLTILALIAARFLVRSNEVAIEEESTEKTSWVYVLVLLTVLCVFRFVNLDHTFDFGDEIPVVSFATGLIDGSASLLMEQRKGPSQVTTAAAFMLFDNGYKEFSLRAPFALASVASVLMLYLLGKEMFSDRIGFLGGLLLALDGNYLAHTRFVQFQALVLLMAVSAAYCVWRAGRANDQAERSRYLLLGSVLLGFGCLSHYGGIVVAPALGFLYLSQRPASWSRELRLVIGCALIVLSMVALYYVPFFFAEEHAGNRAHYFGNRLGWDKGMGNTLQELLSFMLFVNSVYYVAFAWLTLMGAVYILWERAHRFRIAVLLAGSSFVLGLGISVVSPDLLQVGPVHLAAVLFLPLLGVVVWEKGLPLASRCMWLWLITGFVILGFFSRQPYTHWYVISPPWALLSGLAVDRAMAFFQKRLARPVRQLVWIPLAFLVAVFGGFLYIFFLREVPAYATDFPMHKGSFYWTPHTGRTGVMFHYWQKGTPDPTQKKWKTVSALYRLGVLRGHARAPRIGGTTGAWYLGLNRDADDSSRYVLHPGDDEDVFSQHDIENWYDLVGRVLVNGVPELWVYEHKETARPGSVTDYETEEYESVYDSLATLDQELRLREVGVDHKTHFRESGLVEAISEPGDLILFTEKEQVMVFGHHYGGTLPYHIPDWIVGPDDLEEWLNELDGPGKIYIVYWAASKSGERERWDDRLASIEGIGEKMWHGNTGLAVYSETGEVDLHLLDGSRLGDFIELLGYEARYVEDDREVELVLYWATEEYVGNDYTVFTHLLDGEGNLVGQKDNPPGRGLMPTSAWRTDKVIRDEYRIPVGEEELTEYWIEAGMYDAMTGERLSTTGEGALTFGRVRLPEPVAVWRDRNSDKGLPG